MKLYVGTYKKYNEGNLYGKWLDLNDYLDKDSFLADCAELHKDEDDPEFMFQDCECDNDLEEKFYSESYISGDYWEYKDALDKCSIDADIVAEFIAYHGYTDLLEGIKAAENSFVGIYDSPADYAEQIIRECNNIPDYLENYIDWESMGRDFGYDDTFIDTKEYSNYGCGHKIAVFYNY